MNHARGQTTLVLAISAIAALVSCSDETNTPSGFRCDETPPSPTYHPGLSVRGEKNFLFVAFSQTEPSSPRVGSNDWTVEITSSHPTQPSPQSARMVAFHGERTGVPEVRVEGKLLSDDRYQFGPFVLAEGGAWHFEFEATFGDDTDRAKFTFCVGDALANDGGTQEGGDAEPLTCMTSAPTECSQPDISYATDIAPIVSERCIPCHDGSQEQWPLTSRSHLVDWRFDIRTRMLDCSMPPADSEITMSTSERQAILEWLRCGMPE